MERTWRGMGIERFVVPRMCAALSANRAARREPLGMPAREGQNLWDFGEAAHQRQIGQKHLLAAVIRAIQAAGTHGGGPDEAKHLVTANRIDEHAQVALVGAGESTSLSRVASISGVVCCSSQSFRSSPVSIRSPWLSIVPVRVWHKMRLGSRSSAATVRSRNRGPITSSWANHLKYSPRASSTV